MHIAWVYDGDDVEWLVAFEEKRERSPHLLERRAAARERTSSIVRRLLAIEAQGEMNAERVEPREQIAIEERAVRGRLKEQLRRGRGPAPSFGGHLEEELRFEQRLATEERELERSPFRREGGVERAHRHLTTHANALLLAGVAVRAGQVARMREHEPDVEHRRHERRGERALAEPERHQPMLRHQLLHLVVSRAAHPRRT